MKRLPSPRFFPVAVFLLAASPFLAALLAEELETKTVDFGWAEVTTPAKMPVDPFSRHSKQPAYERRRFGYEIRCEGRENFLARERVD